ncbi:hypothetical protein Pelo_3790 [Pelomyxa schiedti]|nr:hypothetical protein Pelo_3790 [Pelomyxa schiedti]
MQDSTWTRTGLSYHQRVMTEHSTRPHGYRLGTNKEAFVVPVGAYEAPEFKREHHNAPHQNIPLTTMDNRTGSQNCAPSNFWSVAC